MHIKDYPKLKAGVNHYKLHTLVLESLETLQNRWIHGPTGVGKSRGIRDLHGESLFVKDPNKWWDGYQGEETILIEDLEPEHKFLGWFLKIWADHYPFKAQVKGGYVSLRPKRIIVTSNFTPEEIFENAKILEPIRRRFTVEHMPAPLVPAPPRPLQYPDAYVAPEDR